MAIILVFFTFVLAAVIGERYGQDIFMKRQIDSFMKEADKFCQMYLKNPTIKGVLYNNIHIDENDYKELLFETRDKAIKVSKKFYSINPKYFYRIEEEKLDYAINVEKNIEDIIRVVELQIRKNGW